MNGQHLSRRNFLGAATLGGSAALGAAILGGGRHPRPQVPRAAELTADSKAAATYRYGRFGVDLADSSDFASDVKAWEKLTSITVESTKIYYPGAIPAGPGQYEAACVSLGIKPTICLVPTFSPFTDDLNVASFITACKNAGLTNANICFYQEMMDGTMDPNDYVNVVQHYGGIVHGDGWGVTVCYTLMANAASYWPGNSHADVIGLDFYCDAFVRHGQVLDNYAGIANVPFGLLEIGVDGGSGTPPTETEFANYIAYLQSYMGTAPGGRLAQGLQNAAVNWYEIVGGTGPNVLTPANTQKIALLQGLASDLTGGAA